MPERQSSYSRSFRFFKTFIEDLDNLRNFLFVVGLIVFAIEFIRNLHHIPESPANLGEEQHLAFYIG